MKIRNAVYLGSVAAISLTTGCASIVSRSNWPVAFNSNPPGAEVVVADENGKEVHHGVTPVTFKLPSGAGYFEAANYRVTMTLAGYQPDKSVLKSGINGWYFGNLFLGGLIGGIIVDPMTGAMWKLPNQYQVDLAPVASVTAAPTAAGSDAK